MAASNRQIKRDAAGQPIPQVFDEVADEYQAAKGTDGRQHAILYTADGEPVDLAALVADMAATKAAVVATQAASEAVRAALEGTLTTQLSGSSAVTIGGATFYVDGATIRGLAADRPDAAAAHAVIPYGFYFAIDTGVVYRNTGSAWVS